MIKMNYEKRYEIEWSKGKFNFVSDKLGDIYTMIEGLFKKYGENLGIKEKEIFFYDREDKIARMIQDRIDYSELVDEMGGGQ